MLAVEPQIDEYVLMYYLSEMPKVVGEYDATDLHNRIDSAAAGRLDLSPNDILKILAGDIKYPTIKDAVNIKYARFFNPTAFENYYSDGQVDDLGIINVGPKNTPIDSWHPDNSSSNRLQVLPEILTTASRWPTEFLIGKIAVIPSMKQYRLFEYEYWESNVGKDAIAKAVERGNAFTHKFEPGEVLKVPKGTLHRRNIPNNSHGYRYFMRRFPRFDVFRAGTNLGRMRLF